MPLHRLRQSFRGRRGADAVEVLLEREGNVDLADWYRQNLEDVAGFFRRAFQLLRYNGTEGDYAEFGCMGARTFTLAWQAARLTGHQGQLWAFDSFAGLPATDDRRDDHPQWREGGMAMTEATFHQLCDRRGIPRERYRTVAGFYDESLAPGAPGERPAKVALAYVDCDLYSSTVDVLEFLAPRLQHGSVVAFDDYYCVGPQSASGERMAADEAFAPGAAWQLVPYVQYGWHGMSFLVERSTGDSTGGSGGSGSG